jgi:hypothetical protein
MHASSSGAPFRKRTFSLPLYARSLAAVMTASPVLVRALIRPRISRALREQVMLGVTSVNDCRYCSWGIPPWRCVTAWTWPRCARSSVADHSALTARLTRSPSCMPSTLPASTVMLTRERSEPLRLPGLR